MGVNGGGRNEEEQRAYFEGRVDAKLQEHDVHFVAINGSIEKTGNDLTRLSSLVEGLVNEVRRLAEVGSDPVQGLIQDQRIGAAVADAIASKTEADRTNWERLRGKVQWGGGVLVAAVVIANFAERLLH